MYKLVVLLLFSFYFIQPSYCQEKATLDSLYQNYLTLKSDTARLRALNEFSPDMLMKDRKLAVDLAGTALRLSENSKSKAARAMAIYNYGYLLRYDSKGDSSIYYLLKAKSSFEYLKDTLNLAFVYTQLGANYYSVGNKVDALGCFITSTEMFAIAKDTPGLTKSLGILAQLQGTAGQYTKALKYSLKALELAKVLNDSSAIAKQVLAVGVVYAKLGKNEQGKTFMFEALAINNSIGNKINQFYVYDNLGNIFTQEENSDSCIWAATKAMEVLDTNARPLQYPSAILKLIDAHLHLKNYPKSKIFLDQGFQYCKQRGYTNKLADFHRMYGVYYREQNLFKESKIQYLKGLEVVNSSGNFFQKENYYTSLAFVCNELGDFEGAYYFQRLLTQHKDSIYKLDRAKAEGEAEVRFGLAKKDLEIDLLKKDKVIADRQRVIWIVLFCVGLLVSIIAFLSLRQYKLKQRLRIEKFRNKIARDLHDDVGSTLSSIAMYSEVIKKKAENVLPETIPMLTNMTTSAHELMDAMSDIVWTVNPKHNNMHSLLSRIKQFSSEICEAQDIQFNYSQNGNVEDLKLDMNASQNIYLVLKEAINNALKYSECKNLSLDFNYINKTISFQLSDDGIGFNPSEDAFGNGMHTMKERMQEIQGKLIINSTDKGTTILGEYKI